MPTLPGRIGNYFIRWTPERRVLEFRSTDAMVEINVGTTNYLDTFAQNGLPNLEQVVHIAFEIMALDEVPLGHDQQIIFAGIVRWLYDNMKVPDTRRYKSSDAYLKHQKPLPVPPDEQIPAETIEPSRSSKKFSHFFEPEES